MRAKRLEWRNSDSSLEVADSPIGRFEAGNCYACIYGGHWQTFDVSSFEEAKAACQQEFDRIWREMTEESA